jgi:hypothetical protein
MNNWKYIGAIIDGKPFKINGYNVWDYDWISLNGETITVSDPRYGQTHKMYVYKICVEGTKEITFAAGEFSNCVWGFYEPDNSSS